MARLIEVFAAPGEGGETNEHWQSSQEEQQPEQDEGTILEYILIDVPGDGSCQMSCFNLGVEAAFQLQALQQQCRGWTPDEIEAFVLENFKQVQDEIELPEKLTLQGNHTLYDPGNYELRHQIVEHWKSHKLAYTHGIKLDIQSIIIDMLKAHGLIYLKDASDKVNATTTVAQNTSTQPIDVSSVFSGEHASKEEGMDILDETFARTHSMEAEQKSRDHYVSVPDKDFIFNALYYPEHWQTFHGDASQVDDVGMPVMAFGVDPIALLKMPIPHGVAEGGELAQAIREFVWKLVGPHIVHEGFIPLGTVPVPAVEMIDDDLVDTYIQEFEVNLHLWGTETSLKAAAESADTTVIVHTFDEYGLRLARTTFHDGAAGPVHLYEAGEQSHFQILVGPFDEFFVDPFPKTDEAEQKKSTKSDDENDTESDDEDDEEALLRRLSNFAPGLKIPPGYNRISSSDTMEEDQESEGKVDLDDLRWFLNCLAEELEQDISVIGYGGLAHLLLDAARACRRTFETEEEAAEIIQAYEATDQDDLMVMNEQPAITMSENVVTGEDLVDIAPPELTIPDGVLLTGEETPEEEQQVKDRWFLQVLAHNLGKQNVPPDYAGMLELLFRAAAVRGRNFQDVAQAGTLIQEYEWQQQQKAIEAKSKSGQQWSAGPPLVPLAGFVGTLFTDYHIPLSDILCLLPHAQCYVEFHTKKSSWNAQEAHIRIAALQSMAALLNTWAEIYQQPALYRGPSTAEFTSSTSSIMPGERQGCQMRALLTIDPGSLVGYQPELYGAWQQLNAELPGYVRAHLLNKHLGGPGIPENLAFLSSSDNLKMSQLGEEDVKRMVLEENKQVFYKVEMPAGMDIIHQAVQVDKKLCEAMVNAVHMYACEVQRSYEQNTPGVDCGPDFLQAKYGQGGIGVSRNLAGGITLRTTAPSVETIGKLQAHWTNRMKEKQNQSKQSKMDTFLLEDAFRDLENEAHKKLLTIEDVHDKFDYIASVRQKLLEMGEDEEQIQAIIARLESRWREKAMVIQAKKKQESDPRGLRKRRNAARLNLLRSKQIKVTQPQLEDLLKLGDKTFNKYLLFRAHCSHSEALRNSRLRKGYAPYKEAEKGLHNKVQQTGIHAHFNTAEKKEKK